MKGNLSQKEPEISKYWEDLAIYKKMRALSRGRKQFVLHDGPPFANGTPHAGTAMNKILKDIIVRMKQMNGYDAPFVPGWDCHGLPIEWKIEENLIKNKQKKEDIPVDEFRNMCRDFAQHWICVQKDGFKRLGVNCDWDNSYLTMNNRSEAAVIRQVGQFIVEGTLYRGEKPVFWSVVEKTALADAEIEYLDKKSTSIYVSFEVKSTKYDKLSNANCVIWTTTPWTIPGNRAISYGNDIVYCLLKMHDKQFVIARDLVEDFAAKMQAPIDVLDEFIGNRLCETVCRHPLHMSGYDFDVPLIHGDHVLTDSGTGLVHTAPGHGVDDFNVCKLHHIKPPLTVNESGVYYDTVPLFGGKHIFKAEVDILQAIKSANALLLEASITHSYPHSWRSKAPLIFRTTPQWFISMDGTNLREKTLDAIENTSWIPKQSYNRIKSFVENRGDWCVSRQRVWGVPLPIFVSKKTGEPIRDINLINRIANIFESEGSNAWFTKEPQYFLGDDYQAADYVQTKDTLDVWFESASTHAYVIKSSDANAKADLCLEGSDQHRGWFQHSLLNSCGTFGCSPFKSVLTHGFIVDESGRKMSKSVGNVVTLSETIEKLGADIFRMFVAGSDFTQDLKLGPNILKQLEDVYRKIRNTIKYMLGALSGFNENNECIQYEEMPDLEKWALHRLSEIHEELMCCIDNYDINKYFITLHTFCSVELSTFLFDVRKDCLYCDHQLDTKRVAYRCVLNVLFQYILRWLSPIMVYTCEEAWLSRYKTSSIHLEEFLVPDPKWRSVEIGAKVHTVRELRKIITAALEKARQNRIIGSSLQAKVTIYDPQNICNIHVCDYEFWKEICIVSDFTVEISSIPIEAFVGEDAKNIGVIISVAVGEKCERCWKISSDLNEDQACKRCQSVLLKNR